jgi:hypothetical protein
MPELFRFFGMRFFFFSNDHLPIHIHVKNADGTAKFAIDPARLLENNGIKRKDISLAESIIEENREVIINHWNDFFKK